MTGIDISGVQPDDVPGGWEFIVIKSTEGNTVVNPRVAAQWKNAARTTRGLYHYARPNLSPGASQAATFATDALARGFKPGVDLWQLDAEDGENAGVTNWGLFIDQFMQTATSMLGDRGYLYAGWPFVQAHGLQAQIHRWKWWLPAYGANDGNVNPYAPGTPADLVVIHQYTSHGGLDQNRIVNRSIYSGSTPAPIPAPSSEEPMLIAAPTQPDPNQWRGAVVNVAARTMIALGGAVIDPPLDKVEGASPWQGVSVDGGGKFTIVADTPDARNNAPYRHTVK